ncbi:MAG: VOC family protein [Candidatus Bathyarchaeia archaeon]
MKIKEISHVAAVVRDLNRSLKMYKEILGIEPWIIQSFVPPFHRETYVREKPVKYTMRIAIASLGKIYYELIEPLEGPSIYKEFLDAKGEGLHHIGKVYTSLEEVERDLEMFKKMGLRILQRGAFYDSRYYYIDTEPLLGVIYEVVYKPSEIPPEKVYP